MADVKKGIVCPPEPSVFVWNVSYFLNTTKKWSNGELQVTPSTLCFYDHHAQTASVNTPAEQSKSLLQLLKLDNITEIKKASSSYVFKCIVVITKVGEEHWFGSFPGRDGAYNALLHFWRERLLLSKKSSPTPAGRTKMGQELLEVAQESCDTLRDASETLKHQGEQMNYARSVMYDLHNDLDVAEHLTSSLESWFSHWGMPHPTMPSEEVVLVDTKGVPVIHEFPILYHEAKAHTSNHHSLLTKVHLSPKRGPPIHEENGTLRLSQDGATIIDTDLKHVYHYDDKDISVVNVSSPWKMAIVKYCIGEPDVVYKVTSTQLMEILRVFHTIVHDKIQYESPLEEPVIPRITDDPAHTDHLTATHPEPPHQSQLQVTVHASQSGASRESPAIVTNAEAQELSDMVSNMKSMAVNIQTEQDKQMETIDQLTNTVDNANIRLQHETQRVNKLM